MAKFLNASLSKFPKGFLWGTSTSAHQIEGNNTNSDWWYWEQNKPKNRKWPLEPSNKACNSYNLYSTDFDLCKKLNNNAVRISVEWARLEPKQGTFSKKEFNHYKKVLKDAKNKGLKTFVTLHHFTSPLWFYKKYGWHNPKSAKLFAIYAKKCAKEFGDLIDYYITINEPQVYLYMSYLKGVWPPSKKNPFLAFITNLNFMYAHSLSYKAIKSVNSDYAVGIVKNIAWYEPKNKYNLLDLIVSKFLYFLGADSLLLPIKKYLDFIGLNYYFSNRINFFKNANPNDIVSDLGWWIYPKGLEHVLISLKKYNLPIYITENGLADSKDALRIKFIKSMLQSCLNAINKGVKLKGYFYWSLLDNYEWHEGFWPKFGLVHVNLKTFKRTPRKSFYYYSKIAKLNSLKI